MEVTEFSLGQNATIESLFSPTISSDSWVLYHATSSIAEERIDAAGLAASLDHDSTLIKLLKVFRAMNWAGENGAGYPVLKGFSLQRGSLPNLYFRASSTGPLLFAKPDFAGGETVRGLYHALEELKVYAADPLVRERHYAQQVACCKELVKQNGRPTHVIRVDIEWLGARLREFEDVGRKIAELRRSHRYGVVYAVRFDKDDLPFLWNALGSGIVYSRPVPPSKLVAKARVYMDDEYPDFTHNRSEFRVQAKSELMQLLSRRVPVTGAGSEYCSERRGQCDIDAYAGPDEAIDIARRWGTPTIRSMVASGEIRFNE